jgi:hypothetical protein
MPGWRVYPNPVSTILNIESGENPGSIQELELIDTSGKRLKTFIIEPESVTHQLDMSAFRPGLYFIRSVHSDHPYSYKVLKN